MSPFLLINGILNDPADMFTWTDRTERQLQLEHDIPSEKIEYSIGFLRSPKKLKGLVENLAKVIFNYNEKGHRPNVIAHSNGNVLICRALAAHTGIKIDTLFMVMPACWADMDHSGLNAALRRVQIQRIVFYGSQSDRIVKWGGKTRILRRLGLGYGNASHAGLLNIDPSIAAQVTQHDKTPWRHSTFAQYDILPEFIREIVSQAPSRIQVD